MLHNKFSECQCVLYTCDLIFFNCSYHFFYCFITGGSMYNKFSKHWVIKDRDIHSFLITAVYANTWALGSFISCQLPDIWKKVIGWVLCIYPQLYRMSPDI